MIDCGLLQQSCGATPARSRALQQFLVPENRAEVFAWLKTIQAWKVQAPGLIVLPGHDIEWIVDPLNKTGVIGGFSPPAI